jgi:hypothetical protein
VFRKIYIYLIAVVCLTLIAVGPAFGQASGTIAGRVTDSTGAVVPNVNVTITNNATGIARDTVTNSDGSFSAPSLQAGDYQVHVQAQGFSMLEQAATVQAGSTTTLNLVVVPGTAQQTVTVSASVLPQIDYETNTVQGLINNETVKDLPLNGRNILQLATLEPGITTTPASVGVFNAQFQVQYLGVNNRAYVTIDAGSIADQVEAPGGVGMNFSNEIVQEFQSSSVNFQLNTGVTSSGAINIVTKSGTNQLHGAVYNFFRDHYMAAYPGLRRSTLDPSPYFQRENPGVWVGGPIMKDKAFFFFNYEYTKQLQAIQVQPDLPSIIGLEDVFSSPYVSKSITARFDYKLNDSNSAFLRYSHDGNNGFGPQNVGAPEPSYWTDEVNWADQGVFGVTSVLTSNMVNDFHLAFFYWNRANTLPPSSQCVSPCVGYGLPGIALLLGSSAGFTFGNNPITPQIGTLHRYQIIEDLSWHKGNHSLRFGGQFYRDESPIAWGFCTPACEEAAAPEYINANVPAGIVSTYFSTLPSVIQTNNNLLNLPVIGTQASASGGIGLGSANNPGAYEPGGYANDKPQFYAKDSWQERPNLTLNAGVGVMWERGLFNTDVPKPAFLEPIYGSNLQGTRNNGLQWSPQLGFSWALGSSRKTVIRGGAGLYWDTQSQFQRYRDRSAITPVGNGRQTVSTNILQNPYPNIIEVLNGQAVPIPIGGYIPTGTITNLTLGQFDQMLNTQIPNLIQTFSPTAQTSGPITVSAIDVLKSGAELYPHSFPLPRSYQMSIGVQRDLGLGMVLTADYVRKITTETQIGEEDFNHFNAVAGPVIPKCPTPNFVAGVECSNGPITFWMDGGRSVYNGLLARVTKRLSNHVQGTVSYAFQSLDGLDGVNTVFNFNAPFQSFGPELAHNNLNISGVGKLPWGFEISLNQSIISLTPFEPEVPGGDTSGTGANATSSTHSPLPGLTYGCFNAGCGKGTLRTAVAAWNNANSKFPSGNPTPKLVLPPVFNFGDPTYTTNTRLTKVFTYKERYKLDLYGEVFNLFNDSNLTTYGTVLDSYNTAACGPLPAGAYTTSCAAQTYAFGKPTQRSIQTFGQTGPRAEQIAARIEF